MIDLNLFMQIWDRASMRVQGCIEEVSADGYDDWKQGALVGVHYALAKCGISSCRVVMTKIEGMTTDTNPTIVAAAQALWAAAEYIPSVEEKAYVE